MINEIMCDLLSLYVRRNDTDNINTLLNCLTQLNKLGLSLKTNFDSSNENHKILVDYLQKNNPSFLKLTQSSQSKNLNSIEELLQYSVTKDERELFKKTRSLLEELEKEIPSISIANYFLAKNSLNNSLIHLAIINDNTVMLALLLEITYINIHEKNETATPLELAFKKGNIEAIYLLLKAGAGIGAKIYGDIPAAFNGEHFVLIDFHLNGKKISQEDLLFKNSITNILELKAAIKKGIALNKERLQQSCKALTIYYDDKDHYEIDIKTIEAIQKYLSKIKTLEKEEKTEIEEKELVFSF